jgi:hypothetical protein
MTTTSKPVQRCTEQPYSVLFPGRACKSRAIVVRIEKGDLLRFREKGRRHWYDMPIEMAASIAVQASAGFRVCMMPGLREKTGGAKRRR